ncbi:hypothetical protein VNO77_04287 [Canavalia gladiata]|uniref:Uncharacterized protein n=1 Tax=Canavalia gladiata TaxID=3824 RepID=A0AAN9N2S1_CANGL
MIMINQGFNVLKVMPNFKDGGDDVESFQGFSPLSSTTRPKLPNLSFHVRVMMFRFGDVVGYSGDCRIISMVESDEVLDILVKVGQELSILVEWFSKILQSFVL